MNGQDAIRAMVRDYPGGIEALALRIGRPWQTLDKEVRGAPGYKLGRDMAEAISELCHEAGTPSAGLWIGGLCISHGGSFTPGGCAAEATHADVVQATGAAMREVADVIARVTAAGRDEKYSPNECRQITREAQEAIVALQQLLDNVAGCARPKRARGK